MICTAFFGWEESLLCLGYWFVRSVVFVLVFCSLSFAFLKEREDVTASLFFLPQNTLPVLPLSD